MIGIDDFVAYVEIAIAHHEGTPTSAGGKPTALNYFILSCRERQFRAGLRSHGKPGSVNAVRGIAPSNRLRFAARSRGTELPTPTIELLVIQFRFSDPGQRSGSRTVGIDPLFWPCCVLIFYRRPEAPKHPHSGFAHLDYNGAV